jgi:tyrosyl-DNA phosphodiesterase 2
MRDCFRVLDGIIDRRVEEKKNRGEGAPGKTKNAIFAGDTNWDEKSDGDVPLGSEWSDAWVTNGDGSPGYTYDLRKNQMMSGWLQKRLDRVFFRLESFDVSKIEMVGNEPIKRKDGSTITYVNEWKGRSETKPVLPSDHFGLLVTLQKK